MFEAASIPGNILCNSILKPLGLPLLYRRVESPVLPRKGFGEYSEFKGIERRHARPPANYKESLKLTSKKYVLISPSARSLPRTSDYPGGAEPSLRHGLRDPFQSPVPLCRM